MRRDVQIAVVIWIVITLAAVAVAAFVMNPFPAEAAHEASYIDDAFMIMTYMAAPVFAIVMTTLLWGVPRWRSRHTGDQPPEDGPALLGNNWFPKFWLVATAALAAVVMIFPGLTGIAELRSDDTADMRVEVKGVSWQWLISYPDQGITLSSNAGDELVLPVDTRIQFDVTALDVLHSFWIPAFRQKIDAVPGQTTVIYTTTTETGDRSQDEAFRVQCAELCGLDHSVMAMSVRVVTQADFDAWLASKGAAAAKVSN